MDTDILSGNYFVERGWNLKIPEEMLNEILTIAERIYPLVTLEGAQDFLKRVEFPVEGTYWEGKYWIFDWKYPRTYGNTHDYRNTNPFAQRSDVLHPVFIFYHKANAWGKSPITKVWLRNGFFQGTQN